MLSLLCEFFGWLWIGAGIGVGALLGLRFHKEDWLGGYASWPRRLIRLGHIAMIALGALAILFAYSLPRVVLPFPIPVLAAACLIGGAILMPACCFITAFRPSLRPLFLSPVLLLGLGVTITWIGLLRSLLLAGSTP